MENKWEDKLTSWRRGWDRMGLGWMVWDGVGIRLGFVRSCVRDGRKPKHRTERVLDGFGIGGVFGDELWNRLCVCVFRVLNHFCFCK